MSKDKVKDIGFTAEERKLCIKALMTYQEIEWAKDETYQPPFLPPSKDEMKTIDLLIGDFKGPSWAQSEDE